MSYPNHSLPIPLQSYYTPYDTHTQPSRPDTSQRKRPKYTRSKTGCLTCRVKKIKCDETKPSCMRCTHGSRECTWPEGVPVRKKATVKKDSIDGRPSTAGSSGLSDASTPPTREHTPPRRPQLDMNILPPPLRSPSDDFFHLQQAISSDHNSTRRQPGSEYLPQLCSNPIPLHTIPESSYQGSSRYYDQSYLHHPHSSHSSRYMMSGSNRTSSHHSTSHWNSPPETPTSINPYHHGSIHERTTLGHSSQNDHSHNRYR